MYDYKEPWKLKIAEILSGFNGSIDPAQVIAEIPPKSEMGDLGFPMFGFAKLLKKGPAQIAQMIAAELPGSVADGPYINVRLNRSEIARDIISELLGGTIDKGGTPVGKRVMVEFSSPNTNKPLHLGHLRNDVLGESISRILSACGAEVCRVCIINDRGIHICKSMLAYKEQGEGKTPESEGIKSDHFVGDWYVRFSQSLKEETEALEKEKGLSKKEAETQAPLLCRAQELLRQWEARDSETVAL
jgi:arginyl-tRNA synthetase